MPLPEYVQSWTRAIAVRATVIAPLTLPEKEQPSRAAVAKVLASSAVSATAKRQPARTVMCVVRISGTYSCLYLIKSLRCKGSLHAP